ncbi:hypothetical protein ACFL1G_03370 [Planctomycetota bacterium]
MIAKKPIEKKLEELGRAIGSEDSLVDEVMSRIDARPIAQPTRLLRRFIMNRFTKLTAAAVIVASILIFFRQFGTSAVYGITDLPKILKQAKTVHIKGWGFIPQNDEIEGKDLQKQNLDFWFDIENGRYRMLKPGGFFRTDLNKPMYFLEICDGEYIMETSYFSSLEDNILVPQVSFKKMNSYEQRLQTHKMLNSFFPPFMSDPEQIRGFVKSGQEVINGELLDIWKGEMITAGSSVPSGKVKIWMSPDSGKMCRMLMWHNMEKSSVTWLPLLDIDTVEYDVEVPPDCFKTEPPEGYKLLNTKGSALVKEIGDDVSDSKFYVCIGFTMSDGSVIVGWHANSEPDNLQEHLFENLKPGDPLPKLPAQITELTPYPAMNGLKWIGHHLAYTEKNNKFYEWSIYVSKTESPRRNTFNWYDIVRKYNGAEPRSFGGWPRSIIDDIAINSEDDFKTWVRGAMSQLSDDGKTPEDVTFDSVLYLAERIRNSLHE